MNIGIVGPVNPAEFNSFFHNVDVPEMNLGASAVQALVTSFLDAGHNLSIFTINSKDNTYKEFISDQLKIYAVPFRLAPYTSIFKLYAAYNLKKCIKRHLAELDLLHAQWTYEYAYASKVFAKRIPVFCTVRDWCPYIMTTMRKTFYKKVEWEVNYFLFRKVMKSSYIHFIANSDYTSSRVKTGYPEKNIVTIPNSIKKELIKEQREQKVEGIRLISIANGVFDPRKNVITLLRAFKMLKKKHANAKLTIVGRCPKDNPEFEIWEKEGLFEDVILTGMLDHDDVIKQIDLSTILIHPSLEETFGNILLEAMARRVPVIGGSDSGAVPIVLGNGKYGMCCDVTSQDSLLQAILALLDEHNQTEMVNNATTYLKKTYSSDVVCERHIQEYSKYINKIK